MRAVIVGCGYVADLYAATFAQHQTFKIAGAVDRDQDRAASFVSRYGGKHYANLCEALNDDQIQIVVNLTNPASHFEVSKLALESGKHVYCEKPLAMDLEKARELVELAERKKLHLASAPCSFLSSSAQTLWKAVRERVIGTPRLVYASMDDGMVHRSMYRKWINDRGIAWPWKDEFEVGCTLEHAGYYLAWLPAIFGPAVNVTAFSSCQIPDKETDSPLDMQSPDFSTACIAFSSGVVARLTCSIIAPHDRSLKVFGDEGVLYLDDCWDNAIAVKVRRWINIRRRTMLSPWARRYRLDSGPRGRVRRRGAGQMDFNLGIAEMVEAISANRPCRLSARYGLHVTELALAIANAGREAAPYRVTTTFDPIEPVVWAK